MDHIQESKYYDYDSYSLFFFFYQRTANTAIYTQNRAGNIVHF
jgi:hypothetical protein